MENSQRNTSISADQKPENHPVLRMNTVSERAWRDYLNSLCLLFLFVYLLFIPSGMLGFALAVACLVSKLATTRNFESLGLYMLLFGVKTIGLVTLVFGLPGIGGKIALATGLLLLTFFSNLSRALSFLRLPLLYMIWVGIILYWAYIDGPQTTYSSGKLSNSIIFGILFLISFYYLLNSRNIDWAFLGQLGILSALVILTACLVVLPHLKPNSILDIGAIRIAADLSRDTFEFRNILGGITLLSFVLILASSSDRFLSRLSLTHLSCYSFAAMVILLWGGSRLPLLSAMIAIFSMLLVKPYYKKRYKILTGITFSIFICIIAYGQSQQLEFITSVTDSSHSLFTRVNRSTNWEAGYRRIIEKPIFGHGLGGYYIEGYSHPGEGTYAHNLALELISETGLVRTLLILMPLLLWRHLMEEVSFSMRAQNRSPVVPLIIMLFVQSMISFDLSINIGLLALLAALRGGTQKIKKQPYKR